MKSVSVVICTRNQAPRLRLVLAALSVQSLRAHEVIVVDDASNDETSKVLEETRAWFDAGVLRGVRLDPNRGSPGARNHGASHATGDVLLFLDSDALPTRNHLEQHLAAQAARHPAVVFGPLWHTTTTEYLRDPSRGIPFDMPVPEVVRGRLESRLDEMLVTEAQVRDDFASIVARSAPGTYPQLGHIEREAERFDVDSPPHPALWVLVSPQNLSMPRSAYEAARGFDASLPFCEGWDLCLTLMERGLPVVRTAKAPIYHLYHHHAAEFGQALVRWRAMRLISAKHRQRALLLVLMSFAYRSGDPMLPKEVGPLDIDHLGALFERHRGDDLGPYEKILRGHPTLGELDAAVARAGASPAPAPAIP